MERRVALLIPRVHVRARLDESLGEELAADAHVMKGRRTIGVAGGDVRSRRDDLERSPRI